MPNASEQVINLFKTRGAVVEEVWVNGHEITETGLTAGQQILGKYKFHKKAKRWKRFLLLICLFSHFEAPYGMLNTSIDLLYTKICR